MDALYFRNATTAGGQCELAARVVLDDASAHTDFGAPNAVWVRLGFGGSVMTGQGGEAERRGVDNSTAVDLTFELFEKTPTRFAEAVMLNVGAAPRSGFEWRMDKMGELVDPKYVMTNGSQWQHGIDSGVEFTDASSLGGGMRVVAFDTPLACPSVTGQSDADSPTPFPVPLSAISGKITGFGFK